jgi:hypothetical protein
MENIFVFLTILYFLTSFTIFYTIFDFSGKGFYTVFVAALKRKDAFSKFARRHFSEEILFYPPLKTEESGG